MTTRKMQTGGDDIYPLFQVTVESVIGEVFEGDSDMTPYQAAFQLVASHSADHMGTNHYKFPGANGNTVEVAVTNERPDA